MATATTKSQCSVCKKETSTFNCDGCLQKFCRTDLINHLQLLGEQLDRIEVDHDQLRQKFIDQKNHSKTHSLIEEINKWEEYSIQIIKQTANECREKLVNYINKSFNQLENELNNLAKQMKTVREENEFNEIDLNHLKEKLTMLEKQLNQPSNILIKQKSISFINKIFVNTILNTKWKQNGITIVGKNGHGNQLNQVQHPRGISIDDDQTLYTADWKNHRIVEWKSNTTNGRIVAGGNGPGNQMNQLNRPIDVTLDKENNSLIVADYGNRRVMRWSRQNNTTNGEVIISDIACMGLAIDKDGSLYVSDTMKNEVRRWKKGENNGTIVAGGNGNGDLLNQLNFPIYIFVAEDYSLYVSDMNNDRVMKWEIDAKQGIVVAGGNGKGNSLTQLSRPQGVIVDQFGKIFVADWDNHRVIRWCEGEKEGSIVVGGNGQGEQPNQFSNPQSLSFDREGNLYIGDCNNNRIQKFEIDFDQMKKHFD